MKHGLIAILTTFSTSQIAQAGFDCIELVVPTFDISCIKPCPPPCPPAVRQPVLLSKTVYYRLDGPQGVEVIVQDGLNGAEITRYLENETTPRPDAGGYGPQLTVKPESAQPLPPPPKDYTADLPPETIEK